MQSYRVASKMSVGKERADGVCNKGIKKQRYVLNFIKTTLCILLLVSGTGCESAYFSPQYAYTFYTLRTEGSTGGIYAPREVYLEYPPDIISPLLLIHTFFYLENTEDSTNPFPKGVAVYAIELSSSGVLEVEFSPEYGELSGIRRTAADFALMLTLTQLPQVNGLRIQVFGEEKNKEVLRSSQLEAYNLY